MTDEPREAATVRARRGCDCRSLFRIGGGLLLALLVGEVVFSLTVNRRIPDEPTQLDRLSAIDVARVEEALQLRPALGSEVWPGWAEHAAPLLVSNDEFAFLFGADTAPAGWEAVDGMYRSDQDRDWQAFAERLEYDFWVGSAGTKAALDRFLIGKVGGLIPDPLDAVLPLGLLVTSTDQYVSVLLHESFHAYQAEVAPARFDDTQQPDVSSEGHDSISAAYEHADEAMRDDWRQEGRLLAQALGAATDEEAERLVRQWVAVREARRADMAPELILYERRFEWLEGLAKYVELGIWEAASGVDEYEPVQALAEDDQFHAYRRFGGRYRSELLTLRSVVTQSGDTRFYYTGMAQARLLDRLLPGWKARVFEDGVWLEDLLAEAVGG